MKHPIVHQALLRIKAARKEPGWGVCDNFDEEMDALYCLSGKDYSNAPVVLQTLIREWPEHSGSRAFPVPCPECWMAEDRGDAFGCDRAEWAYYKATDAERWDPEHPYGAARWRLLEYLLERLA